MIRRLLSLFFLLVSTDAWATTRWVSPSGSGSTYSFAVPGSLSGANSASSAGDIVMLHVGTYTTAISPANNGSAGNYIRYISRSANVDSVVIPNTTLTKRYISINGVRFSGDLSLDATSTSQFARYDSVVYCKIIRSLFLNQCKSNVIYRTDITGGSGKVNIGLPGRVWEQGAPAYVVPEANRIGRCNITVGHDVITGWHPWRMYYAQSNQIDSNIVNIELDADIIDEIDPFESHYATSNAMFDNRWTVTNNHHLAHLFRMRDSSNYNTVLRDTFVFYGNNTRISINSSGNTGTPGHDNSWKYCVVKNNCSPNTGAFYIDAAMCSDTIQNCAVVSQYGMALYTVGGIDTATSTRKTTLIDHNTFVGNTDGLSAGNYLGGAVFFDYGDDEAVWTPGATLKFTNNIVYNRSGTRPSAIGYGFQNANDSLIANNNLYYNPDGAVTKAITYQTGQCGADCPVIPSTPGPPFSQYKVGQELYSVWGDPLLGGVNFDNFDWTLSANSPARSKGSGGTDIGVNAATAGDVTRPYVIVAVVSSSADGEATISWVSTGDDSLQGTCASVDVRYSTSQITDAAGWAAAQNPAGEPVPMVAGTTQTLRVRGLTNGTYYYFAVRTTDEAGNISAIPTNTCAYPPFLCE